MGFVYLIKEESNENKYKIGMTNKTLEQRMNSLQTGNPNKLTLINYHESKNPKAVEKTLHNFFRHKNILREWFDLDEDDINKFKPICEQVESNIQSLLDNPYTPYKNVQNEHQSFGNTDEDKFLLQIGNKIKSFRKSNSISISKLSETLEVNQEYINDIESGKKNPSLIFIYKLAKALNINISDFFK